MVYSDHPQTFMQWSYYSKDSILSLGHPLATTTTGHIGWRQARGGHEEGESALESLSREDLNCVFRPSPDVRASGRPAVLF